MDTNHVQKVAAYIRVSTEEQKLHGISLDAQIMKLEEFATTHNLKIVEWYKDEGVSGRKLIRKRPELQRMLLDAKNGKFERIIFIKLDRFFRSVAEYHECMKMISPVVWTATEEKYDLTTASGRAFVNMKLTIAELEADQTGERISIVNDYKVKNGQAITGSVPLGYKVEKGSDGVKRVVKDGKTSRIVEEFLSNYMIHQSKRQALIWLRETYDISMTYTSFNNLITNTLYKGEYRGNKEYCPSYLSPEEWDKLQIISRRNARKKQHFTYLFSGMIRCPVCGSLLKGAHKNNAVISVDGSKKNYIYKTYRCNRHQIHRYCTYSKLPRESSLERMLLSEMEKYLDDYLQRFSLAHGKPERKVDVSSVKDEIDRLNYSWQKNRISMEDYDNQYEELMKKLKKATDSDVPTIDLTSTKNALSDGWREMYEELSLENRKAFWRSFISEIRLDDIKISEVDFF